MDTDDLQQLIDRELKALPAPGAPGSLLPRVLAATVRRKAPWYARPWLAWPHQWQLASVALLMALGVALSMVLAAPPKPVGPPVLRTAAAAPSSVGPVAAVANTLEQAATLMRVCWKVLLEPMAFWLLVLAVSLSLACAALWSALERAALGGASQQ